MIQKETRANQITATPKTETDEQSRHVEGYALVFDSQSEDMGFREIIDREALNEDILKRSDVLCTLNHNEDRGVLARSRYGEGSLTLTIDDRGLKYEFDAPHTALGDELLESIRRGDISQSSFAFTVEQDEWDEDYTVRTIKKFKRLYDVSPVYTPAYSETSVNVRQLREDALKAYFDGLRNKIAD